MNLVILNHRPSLTCHWNHLGSGPARRRSTRHFHEVALLCLSMMVAIPSALEASGTELLQDGDFDKLPVGTAPDNDQPAGNWLLPPVYATLWDGDGRERYPEMFTIVETSSFDPTGTGHSLKLDSTLASDRGLSSQLVHMLATEIPETSNGFLRFSYDVFVPEGSTGGGAVMMGSDNNIFHGASSQTDRGPELIWERNNDLRAYMCSGGCNANTTRPIVADYPRDQWQHVQLDLDLSADNYDVYWAAGDDDMELQASNVRFRSQDQTSVDRVSIAHFVGHGKELAYFGNFSAQYISTLTGIALDGSGDTYLQKFDEALGLAPDRGLSLPEGWAGNYTANDFGFETETTKSFPASSTPRGALLYNAGNDGDADRALALGIGTNTDQGMLQLLADVTGADASGFQLAFDLEVWDAGQVTTLGEGAFDVTVELDSGEGFELLTNLGRATTGANLFPPAGDRLDGNADKNRVSFDSGRIDAAIPADSQLRIRWTAPSDAAIQSWVFGLDNVSFALFGGETLTSLIAGDADQDLDFDQLDLVKVQIANKYLTGQAATWGEGDWNGAPGGSPGNPPVGDGLFNQFDIIAAQQGAAYLTGPYAAIQAGGQRGDSQTSVIYDAGSGEISVDAPSGLELTSINIDSAAGIFTGESAQNLGGSFDNDADGNIFKATFGGSFGSVSFGNVAQAGLSEEFVLGDLTVIGSLAGGGDLGNVDLVYVPEPSTTLLLLLGSGGLLASLAPRSRRR